MLPGTRASLTKEPSWLYGKNDVYIQRTVSAGHSSQAKLHVHISRSFWSAMTGLIREYCLPWRWKAAYVSLDGFSKRILVYKPDSQTSEGIDLKLDPSDLFSDSLKNNQIYKEIFGQEFLKLPLSNNERRNVEIPQPWLSWLGRFNGSHTVLNSPHHLFFPIYRIRGVFSLFTYYTLKLFSSEWKEIDLKTSPSIFQTAFIQRVLIQKNTEPLIEQFSNTHPFSLSILTGAVKV